MTVARIEFAQVRRSQTAATIKNALPADVNGMRKRDAKIISDLAVIAAIEDGKVRALTGFKRSNSCRRDSNCKPH